MISNNTHHFSMIATQSWLSEVAEGRSFRNPTKWAINDKATDDGALLTTRRTIEFQQLNIVKNPSIKIINVRVFDCKSQLPSLHSDIKIE